jgi:SAM-dependent methyltransferase/ribosomal protein S27E
VSSQCNYARLLKSEPNSIFKSEPHSLLVMHTVNEMTNVLYDLKLTCPTCKSNSIKLGTLDEDVRCSNCGSVFPVSQGFLDLLPGEESPGMISGSNPMKWGWVAIIYNSRLWRKGRLLGTMFGISFGKEFKIITDAMDISGDETILDLACGPGTYSIPLAEKLDRGFVIGIDLSLPMLKSASKQARKKEQKNVQFIHANVDNLPFLDDEFNNINCCGALHLFSDFLPDLLINIRRMLKTNGRFTVAAALAPKGKIGKKLAARETRNGGLEYFTVDSLTAYLEESGFVDVKCHHAKRYWLIMSALNQ